MNKIRFAFISFLFFQFYILSSPSGHAFSIGGAFHAVTHAASSAAGAVGHVASSTGGAVVHAASSTGQAVVSVAKVPVAVVAAPVKTTIAVGSVVVGKQSLSQAASSTGKAFVAIPKSAGVAVNDTATAAQGFAGVPFYAAEETLGLAGKPGATLADAVTFSQEFSTELSITPIFAAGDILQGQNPLEANPVTVALAAEIEASRDQYKAQAKEIPASVKQALASQYPPNILNKARYAVVSPNITLPTVIIACNVAGGTERYAVTVDNIIVFSQKPPHTVSGIQWWAHELRHVQQYNDWGVLAFAYKYTLHPVYNTGSYDSSPIEQDAIARSNQAVNFLNANPTLLQSWLHSTD